LLHQASQRLERVVSHLTGPDHLPQGAYDVAAEPSERPLDLAEEHSSSSRQKLAELRGKLTGHRLCDACEVGFVLGGVERDAAVV
jgi:hypothetical protein